MIRSINMNWAILESIQQSFYLLDQISTSDVQSFIYKGYCYFIDNIDITVVIILS